MEQFREILDNIIILIGYAVYYAFIVFVCTLPIIAFNMRILTVEKTILFQIPLTLLFIRICIKDSKNKK